MEGELPEEGRGMDFLDYLGPDTSATVFRLLDGPADLARASAVSRSWRRFVIANQFSKIQCLRVYAEVANFTDIEMSSSVGVRQNAGSSACVEFEKLERDHRVYMLLSHGLLSQSNTKNCIIQCIGPSSTDRYPEEAMENTLEPADRVGRRASYWSSRGHRDPAAVAEFLIYRLQSDLCLIAEIKRFSEMMSQYIQQSASGSRWAIGSHLCGLKHLYMVKMKGGSLLIATISGRSHLQNLRCCRSVEYIFPQENVLQSFKLPHPVLCIGGVVKIELLGGVVQDAFDGRYYICVSHVQVVGKPLPRQLGVAPRGNGVVLDYYADPGRCGIPHSESSGDDGRSKRTALRRKSGTLLRLEGRED